MDEYAFFIEFPRTEAARILRSAIRSGKLRSNVYRAVRQQYALGQFCARREGLEELALGLTWINGIGPKSCATIASILADTRAKGE